MNKGRLEAFSDGVLAIIITIMVLELHEPEGVTFSALKPLVPKILSYILSFIFVGIYWNNHHHMFQVIKKVNGAVLWANLFLLFCLSLIPFTTAWMGESHLHNHPVVLYGINLFLCAVAFTIIEKVAIKFEGQDSVLGKAVGSHKKELLSVLLYAAGIASSFFLPLIGVCCYFLVALIWLVPDKRIEKKVQP